MKTFKEVCDLAPVDFHKFMVTDRVSHSETLEKYVEVIDTDLDLSKHEEVTLFRKQTETTYTSLKRRIVTMPWPLQHRELLFVQDFVLMTDVAKGNQWNLMYNHSLTDSRIPVTPRFQRAQIKYQGLVGLPFERKGEKMTRFTVSFDRREK